MVATTKIGRSNGVSRRRRETALLLPKELEHVHVIETDDLDFNLPGDWSFRVGALRQLRQQTPGGIFE
jgi:hypothetical protein